jgi:hypothetical protein
MVCELPFLQFLKYLPVHAGTLNLNTGTGTSMGQITIVEYR